jgi:hypothetical protein
MTVDFKQPPTNWVRVMATEESWETFCYGLHGRTWAMAAQLIRHDDEISIAVAVNRAIEGIAQEFEADKEAPAGMADNYRELYKENRSTMMQLVALAVNRRLELDVDEPARKIAGRDQPGPVASRKTAQRRTSVQ